MFYLFIIVSGFLWMHWVILQQVLSGEDGADVSAAKAR